MHDENEQEADLSSEDHVDTLVLDELGVLRQEGQDVRHLRARRQVAHAYTVPARAVRDEVLGHGDGDGGGGELGDEGGGQLALRLLGVAWIHAAVQNLQHPHTHTHTFPCSKCKREKDANETKETCSLLQSASTHAPPKAQIHHQTQSYDLISCYGNSVKRFNEIAYRIYVPA